MTKIDVFLRLAPQNEIRNGLAYACVARWACDPLVRLTILCAPSPCTSLEWPGNWTSVTLPLQETGSRFTNFQWSSRAYADEHATTEPYILADDDRLPVGKDWVKKAISCWEKYNADHRYVSLHDRSTCIFDDCGLHFQSVHDAETFGEGVVDANWNVGATYLSYKGAIPYSEFFGPACDQDLEVGDWCIKNGKKRGQMVDVRCHHMAVGYSQVVKENCW